MIRKVLATLLVLPLAGCSTDGGAAQDGGSSSTTPNDSGADAPDSSGSDGGVGSFRLVDDGIGCESATGPSATARVGSDCTGNVYVEYAASFDEPITLTVEDLPLGVTAEVRPVNPEGVIPSSRYASVTIRVRGAAAVGAIQPTIKAMTSNHGTASLAVPLTVTSHPGFKLSSVSGGDSHACGVNAAGAGYCWGNNTDGQLGIGTSGATGDHKRMKPAAMTGSLTFSKIAAGYNSTCGLTVAGAAYCWGDGWLGDGQVHNDRATPVAVAGGHTFTDLVVGAASCGLTSAGLIYCWDGGNGFLGNGTFDTGEIPTNVSAGRTYKAVAASTTATCALTTAGKAYCWGNNTWGELGDGSKTSRLSPTAVSTNLVFASLAMSSATCGLTDQGDSYCWGFNGTGGLGIGVFDTDDHLTPVQVTGGLKFESLKGGTGGICGLDVGGKAYCWSFAGTEGNSAVNAPTAIRGDLTFLEISVGYHTSCGVATNGLEAAYCWRNGSGNNNGYLGTGDNQDYKGPVPIASP